MIFFQTGSSTVSEISGPKCKTLNGHISGTADRRTFIFGQFMGLVDAHVVSRCQVDTTSGLTWANFWRISEVLVVPKRLTSSRSHLEIEADNLLDLDTRLDATWFEGTKSKINFGIFPQTSQEVGAKMAFLTISEFYCGARGPHRWVRYTPCGQEGYRGCTEFFSPLGHAPKK